MCFQYIFEGHIQSVSYSCFLNYLQPFKNINAILSSSATSASSGNLLEMRIRGPHPRLRESKLWGWGPARCVITNLPGETEAWLSLRTPYLGSRYSECGLWTNSISLSWELVRKVEGFHSDVQNQSLCIFKSSYSEIMLGLQTRCRNCPASSHTPFPNVTALLNQATVVRTEQLASIGTMLLTTDFTSFSPVSLLCSGFNTG